MAPSWPHGDPARGVALSAGQEAPSAHDGTNAASQTNVARYGKAKHRVGSRARETGRGFLSP